jgi:hypothetical protein
MEIVIAKGQGISTPGSPRVGDHVKVLEFDKIQDKGVVREPSSLGCMSMKLHSREYVSILAEKWQKTAKSTPVFPSRVYAASLA